MTLKQPLFFEVSATDCGDNLTFADIESLLVLILLGVALCLRAYLPGYIIHFYEMD